MSCQTKIWVPLNSYTQLEGFQLQLKSNSTNIHKDKYCIHQNDTLMGTKQKAVGQQWKNATKFVFIFDLSRWRSFVHSSSILNLDNGRHDTCTSLIDEHDSSSICTSFKRTCHRKEATMRGTIISSTQLVTPTGRSKNQCNLHLTYQSWISIKAEIPPLDIRSSPENWTNSISPKQCSK